MSISSADSGVLTNKSWRCFLRRHQMGRFSILLSRVHWQKLMNRKVGIIPVPLYFIIFACLGVLLALGKVSGDISIMFALLTVLGFACAELGARIPSLRQIGGPVIVTIFSPRLFGSLQAFT